MVDTADAAGAVVVVNPGLELPYGRETAPPEGAGENEVSRLGYTCAGAVAGTFCELRLGVFVSIRRSEGRR